MTLRPGPISRMLSPSEERGLLYFGVHQTAEHNAAQMATAKRLAEFAGHPLVELPTPTTVKLTELGREVYRVLTGSFPKHAQPGKDV